MGVFDFGLMLFEHYVMRRMIVVDVQGESYPSIIFTKQLMLSQYEGEHNEEYTRC